MNYATAKNVDVSTIPVIEMAPLIDGTPDARRRVAGEFRRAATEIGFFYVRNHNVAPAVIDRADEHRRRADGLRDRRGQEDGSGLQDRRRLQQGRRDADLPALAGQFIMPIKTSSIVSLISIQELTFIATEVAVTSGRVFEVWITVAALYFAVSAELSLAFRRLERGGVRFAH